MKNYFDQSLNCRALARELGWEMELSAYDKSQERIIDFEGIGEPPYFPLSFSKGHKRIWHCAFGWAYAELNMKASQPTYINHTYHRDLEHQLRSNN